MVRKQEPPVSSGNCADDTATDTKDNDLQKAYIKKFVILL